MKAAPAALALCLALAVTACGDADSSTSVSAEGVGKSRPVEEVGESRPSPSAVEAPERHEPKVRAPKGAPPEKLVVKDLIVGEGAPAKEGDELTVEYVGTFYDGEQFTNSWDRAKPFSFQLGSNEIRVNPGWERGLRGMRVGGRRELIVPPYLLYQGGAPSESSPEDSLAYVIDLLEIR